MIKQKGKILGFFKKLFTIKRHAEFKIREIDGLDRWGKLDKPKKSDKYMFEADVERPNNSEISAIGYFEGIGSVLMSPSNVYKISYFYKYYKEKPVLQDEINKFKKILKIRGVFSESKEELQ